MNRLNSFRPLSALSPAAFRDLLASIEAWSLIELPGVTPARSASEREQARHAGDLVWRAIQHELCCPPAQLALAGLLRSALERFYAGRVCYRPATADYPDETVATLEFVASRCVHRVDDP
mgnify:FL=1